MVYSVLYGDYSERDFLFAWFRGFHFNNIIHYEYAFREVYIEFFLIYFCLFPVFEIAGFYFIIGRLVPEIGFQFREVGIYFGLGTQGFIPAAGADEQQAEPLVGASAGPAGFFIDLGLFFISRSTRGSLCMIT